MVETPSSKRRGQPAPRLGKMAPVARQNALMIAKKRKLSQKAIRKRSL
jgi:hypothetical protein